jgi:predicted Zn-dependent peptidase
VLKADMPLAVDVLSDILSNPTFDPAELKREQNVIVQEIGASEDNPDDLVFDYLQSTAFPDQPIGRPILGTRESVCSFKDKNLRAYLDRNYKAPDMVFAATGAVEHAAVVAEAERRFGHFKGPPGPAPLPATFGGGTKLEARDLEQVHIALALEGLSQKHPSYFSLQVFAIVLGGGMSSRLFQEVREKRGLCYTISAFHAPYTDTGMFGIYAGTDAGDVNELMKVAVEEVSLCAANLSEAELNRAKAQIKVGLLMALESSGARARQLANQILIYGRPLTIEEMVARIETVTVESARAAGAELIGRGAPAIAALGPAKGLESAATIAESFKRRAA